MGTMHARPATTKVLAIAGSRSFCDVMLMDRVADQVLTTNPSNLIITGDMFGADYEAGLFAGRRGIPFVIYQASADTDEARTVRNQQIIDAADALLVFWDGSSPGTLQKIQMAERKGIPTFVHRFDPMQQPPMAAAKCRMRFCCEMAAMLARSRTQ